MASNPMQRKSRNSFLLGVIVTLIIAGVAIALLLLQLKQKDDQIKAEEEAKTSIYVLNQDVKAAQILTIDMFRQMKVNRNTIPVNATNTISVIDSWYLQTKDGETVCTDTYGLYLDRSYGTPASDMIIEVLQNTGASIQDADGNTIATGEYYAEVDGTIRKVSTSSSSIQTDDEGMFIVDTQDYDKKTRVYQEDSTYEFYVYRLETSTTTGARTRVKEYLDITNVPVIAKVDMYANTVITPELVVQSSEIITDDTRIEEYNMLVLPIDLMTDDYVDIRLMTPNGENFIVVSKARVEVPMNYDGTYIADTIKVSLREDEILSMSSAIVEANGLAGSKLYVTKYADPAMQTAAIPTYVPNAAVTAQIEANPNIVSIASAELAQRYSDASKNARNQYLQQYINSIDSNEYNSNVQSGMEENIGTSITTRKRYLETLN